MPPRRVLALSAVLLGAAACPTRDPVAFTRDGSVDLPSYCDGDGPPILVGDSITVGGGGGGGDDVCAGDVAVRSFRFALCTCEGYQSATTLTTDSFSSAAGPYAPGGAGGSIGTNGDFAANGGATVGGSLWVAGPAGVQSGADLDVAGDLNDGGDLFLDVTVTVGRDANVSGDIDLASLTVDDTLTIPQASTIDVSGTLTAGATVRADVAIAPPCACAPDDLVDVTGFVGTHRTANDNASIGLSSDALLAVTAETTIDLPCGRFYLSAIGIDAPLTIRVSDRTALLVGGDVDLRAPFVVELVGEGELDLFVGGLLQSEDDLRLGSAERPARARLYVGGAGTINLSGLALFGGNLYAPRADLVLSGGAELFGSLFVRRLVSAVPLTIHYDTDVLDAGDDCPTAPTSCVSCADCGALACIDAACSPCLTDADCCPPLVCSSTGTCTPIIE